MNAFKAILLSAALALLGTPAAGQVSIGSSLTVSNTNDSGIGSLRAAIEYLNSEGCAAGAAITFEMASVTPAVIKPLTPLPAIACTGSQINGFSQVGSAMNTATDGSDNATIKVELDGSLCAGCNGIEVIAPNVTIRGLAIHSFAKGIYVGLSSVFDAFSLQGNYIGTDASGAARGNALWGVYVAAGRAAVGGFSADTRNVIASNDAGGIYLAGSAAVGRIYNNLIDGNGGPGVHYVDAFSSNEVWDNHIRGNNGPGVRIDAGSRVHVEGNSIHANAGKGIDLGTGGNGLPSAPEIVGMAPEPMCDGICTRITAKVTADPSAAPRFEFFQNSAMPSPPQGEQPIAAAQPTEPPDASGVWTINVTVAGTPQNVTAVAHHDLCGDACFATSEFSAVYVPPSPPEAVVSFVPDSILLGQQTMLQVKVVNNNTVGIDAVAYTLTAPAGLEILDSNIGSDCFAVPSGTFSAGASGPTTTASMSGLAMPALGSCTIDYRMVPSTSGTFTFAAESLSVESSAGTGTNGVGATLQVTFVPPTVGFSAPSTTTVGANTPVGIFVSRGSSDPNYFGLDVSFALPAGVLISTTPNAGTSCGASFSAPVGGTAMSATGGAIVSPTGGCTLVTAQVIFPSPGTYTLMVNAGDFSLSSPEVYSNPTAIVHTIVVEPVPAPSVLLTPRSLTFGPQPLTTRSTPQSIVLKNDGTAPLTIVSITTSGDFVHAGCTGPSLPVGESCPIDVVFEPTALGERTGAVTITTDAAGSPHVVPLTGTGSEAPAPAIQLSAKNLAFGPQQVGATSAKKVVTVKNIGTANLNIARVEVTGDFGYMGCGFPSSLAPGESCNLEVTFTPLAVGDRTGALTITTDASGSPHAIALSGTGEQTAIPGIEVAPSSLSFGTLREGSSASARLTVRNLGSAPLQITGIRDSGAAFSHVNRCPGLLEPGASCGIDVAFAPGTPGPHVGDVVILSNAPSSPTIVPLSGQATAIPPPFLALETFALDFGQQLLGTTARRTLELRNLGGRTLRIASFSIVGGGFAVEGGCGDLAPGSACTVELVFRPTEARVYGARLEIASNHEAGTLRLELFGEGVRAPRPELQLSASGIGFGNQTLGTLSGVRTLRILSVGGLPVTLGAMVAPPEFVVDRGRCPTVLASGASCEVDVAFRPTAPGMHEGRLEIGSNAEGPPPFVSLTGTGCRFFFAGFGRDPRRLCGP